MRRPNVLTFTKVPDVKGSTTIAENMDLNGRPYGQVWTYKNEVDTEYAWHLKTLSGYYKVFWGDAFFTAEQQCKNHALFLACAELE